MCHSALAEPLAPEASDQERYRREQEAERAQKQRDAGAVSEDEDETLDLEFVDLAMSEVQVGCVATIRCLTAAGHALRGDTLSPHFCPGHVARCWWWIGTTKSTPSSTTVCRMKLCKASGSTGATSMCSHATSNSHVRACPFPLRITGVCLMCVRARVWGAASQARVDTLRRSRVWRARRLVTC